MGGISLKIKDFLEEFNKRKHERFTKVMGYVFDKYIFRIMFFNIFLLLIIVWGLSGFINPLEHRISLSCPEGFRMCENPLYMNYEYRGSPGVPDYVIDDLEFLPAGFSINPIPWYFKYFDILFICIIITGFLFNHYAHNKGFSFKNLFKQLERDLDSEEDLKMEKNLKGYCMKCRAKHIIKDPVLVNKKTSRGVKSIVMGTCSKCGTRVCVTIKKEA